MAFRRSKSFRGRSFKRAFRGPRVHNVTRPQRWTPANFSLNFVQTTETEGDEINTVIVMAKINRNVFDPGDQANLAEMHRSIEIGGLVFSYNFFHTITALDDEVPAFQLSSHVDQLLLVTDRLDFDGNPVAITTSWFNTQTPVSLAISQTVLDEDTEYPTRIHWRQSHFTDFGTFRGGAGSSATTAIGQSSAVHPSGGRANLRLRTRLSDEQVLAFHFASRWDSPLVATGLSDLTTRVRIVGTLYWRLGRLG